MQSPNKASSSRHWLLLTFADSYFGRTFLYYLPKSGSAKLLLKIAETRYLKGACHILVVMIQA
ncbi:hypothetical protein N0Y54_43620 [Nostoc punctiforme UO1]|uniref:hypothetical protein n=1 Tax=Nostoc punctiforme TaxID=272131 RepID=UPI0030AA07E2|nr:hypothetical protein [Nostoc desertorum CM1-VF14]